MTNLIATISFVVVTNWLTVSITRDVCNQPGCLAMHYNTANQIGARVTNTVATFVWRGQTNQIVLESTLAVSDPTLIRQSLEWPTQFLNWNKPYASDSAYPRQ